MPSDSPFESEIDVLAFVLDLEHLEAALYQHGLERFGAESFVSAGYQLSVRDRLARIADHESAHIDLLTNTITRSGTTPKAGGSYDFPFSDVPGFLRLAAAIENISVAALTGCLPFLANNVELVTAILKIHGVDARHAAYLSLLIAASPFPSAIDAPLTRAEVRELVRPYGVADGL